ncbi:MULTISPECIES: hypothetical protein [unclassified Sphingopyxis]|uniref:hypothetical protein n=1 Tax=unclassified Sphingopyxis TaxID=2614943 RepID=UPI00285F5D9E|nr:MULTISPECIES: hypothetical protein [unclassified Sphingopyxis]MDR7062476.1 hypothetical protein [Sphingopyxis sp. BE235]MDR7182943.1 hypothetical protein [Sphingopyxis sp. BE249]
MTISSALATALEASAKAKVTERPGNVTVEGKLTVKALTAWRGVAAACRPASCKLTCRDSIDEEKKLASADLSALAAEKVRITVEVAQPVGQALIATPAGFIRLLADPDSFERLHTVRLLGAKSFATLGPQILEWTDDEAPQVPVSPSALPSPRRFSRHLSGDLRAPSAIEPWILVGEADASDPFFVAWRHAAAATIARALASETYEVDAKLHVVLAGTPTRRIAFGELGVPDDETFVLLQRAARWVFAESQDVELRHTLLVNELAREWRNDEEFSVGLPKRLETALESAGLAYRAHVQQGSRDTIKSLSDLRKTLAEEIGKVTQQTRDLAASLWRDVAVAIVTIAFRFSMDASKVPNAKATFAIIFALVATYIGVSQFVSVSSNRRFLKLSADSRMLWRRKGYAYLSDDEFSDLAEKPLGDAREIYDGVEKIANRVAGLVVITLLAIAAVESGFAALIWNYLSALPCLCRS